MTIAYSIIIPAYNEEELLPATLGAVDAAMMAAGAPGEVIVVDNNSTDATARIAGERGARVVFEPVNQIARARNAGAAAAKGDILVFLDADTILPPEVLQQALANMAAGGCCGGGALIQMGTASRPIARALVRLWTWLSVRNRWAAGCFVYCSKDGFDAAGGFTEKVYVSEEIWFSRSLGKWGRGRGRAFKIITAPRVRTSDRKLRDQPLRLFFTSLVLLFFPFAIRFRFFCGHWYRRPKKKGAAEA